MCFYKRIFGIFYWPSSLFPVSIDQNLTRISHFLKKYTFVYLVVAFILFTWALLFSHCNRRHNNIGDIPEIILTVKIFTSIEHFSPFFFYFENFKNFWFELNNLDALILKRLKHKTYYRQFKCSFVMCSVVCALLLSVFFVVESVYSVQKRTTVQKGIVLFRWILLYAELHVIFAINLFQYGYNMFGKYIKFAHHLRQSNVIFTNVNGIDRNIRCYKEIHYKFWIISCDMNTVFGISVAIFCFDAFIDCTRSICSLFLIWEKYDTAAMTDSISIVSLESVFLE